MESLHFIRPLWLFALLPAALYTIWYLFLQGHQSKQNNFVDKQLAEFVLSSESQQDHYKWLKAIGIFIASLIAIIALSGPSWEKLPQPLIKQQDAVILLLDLSASMNSQDIKPSRLIRAKQKVADILANRADKQTALVAYAADAYVVTPITDDTKTISTHLPTLNSNTISKQGSRIDRAINKANELFEQTSINKGHVIAFTDGLQLTNETKQAISALNQAGHRLSILGIATKAGGPIPKLHTRTGQQNGFITDQSGNIILSKLERRTLNKAANLGNGVYADITVNDTDIKRLQKQSTLSAGQNKETDRISDQWKDMGAYLVILLLPFLLLCFRRGVFFILPLCFLMVSEPSNAYEWKNLFLNKQQQAHKLFEKQEYNKAEEKFNSPDWQASSQYKSKKYQESLESWNNDSSDGLYNKANTQVQLGQLQDAIKNYEASIELNSDNEDAKYNLELVKKALEQQQNNQNQDGEQNQEGQDQNQDQQSPSEGKQDNKDQQQSGSENSKQNNTDNQESQAEEEAKEALEESLKEAQAEKNKAEAEQENKDKQDVNAAELQEQLQQQEQAILEKQWLDRIEDDPSGLLRRKFEYQDYINKQQQESKPW